MHTGHNFSVQLRSHGGPRVERRVEHVQYLFGHHARVCPGFPHDLPQRSSESGPGRRFDCFGAALRVKCYGRIQCCAIPTLGVVNTGRPGLGGVASPRPEAEVLLQRPRAEVAVEIAVAGPLPAFGLQIDLDV